MGSSWEKYSNWTKVGQRMASILVMWGRLEADGYPGHQGLTLPSQLVLAEGAHSDAGSQGTDSHTDLPPPLERTGGIGDSRPPSFQ